MESFVHGSQLRTAWPELVLGKWAGGGGTVLLGRDGACRVSAQWKAEAPNNTKIFYLTTRAFW